MQPFVPIFWYWFFGIMVLFLPVELLAAMQHKTTGFWGWLLAHGTFSEFIFWVFGIKPRPDGKPVRWAAERHFVLTGMCIALWYHFRFASTVVPVAGFGILVGVVMIRTMFWERKSA